MIHAPAEESSDVLLVEDSPSDATLVRMAFDEFAPWHRLHWVRDGEQALSFLFQRGLYAAAPRPSVVLLDLNLPRLDGFDVLRELKQDALARRIPVLVLSSSQRPADIVRAYELGASVYLAKPNDLDDVARLTESIADFWLQFVSLPKVAGAP